MLCGLGGPHATPCHEELLSDCASVDAVVIGEGEDLMLELVNAYSTGNPGTASSSRIKMRSGEKDGSSLHSTVDIEKLPIPATAMDDAIGVDLHSQLEFIITSRGCSSSCVFCGSPQFWGRAIRFAPPVQSWRNDEIYGTATG